ncbi:hypothetical protein BGZ92_011901 [Podila epicladia]|nr:hypothetical protein BGZ92_011901 [Podila epicladia]
MPPLSPSQLTSIGLAGPAESHPFPIREMDGMDTPVAMNEKREEDMSFLFQDMMRHSVSPQMAHTHALRAKVEVDPIQSWKRDVYIPSNTQVWPTLDPSNTCNMPASVDCEFGMGAHFDQGQADLIMGSIMTCASFGNEQRKSLPDHLQLQLQDHHSSSEERAHRQDSLDMNPCYSGLSGLQIEQSTPGEVVIGMGSQPMLSNNTYDIFSSHSHLLFPCQQVVTDRATTQAIVEHEMLNNTVNYDQFGNLASIPAMYNNQDPVYKGFIAPTGPLSVQFEFVNQLPETVLKPEFHHSRMPHFQSIVRPFTPIETTAPFPTPCDNVPVFLHHPNATPSYFPPMSFNEPLVTHSYSSSDMMMEPPQIAPLTMMNGRIEAPPLFQSIGPVDSSVTMTVVPMHLAQSWPSMAHSSQVSSHTLHQSLELMNRLQALQQQQQDSALNQGALYHHSTSKVDRVCGHSHPSTPQSTTTPLLDTPASTVPCSTPQQFQYFPEGTVNLSAIHPSSNFDDKGSAFSPEKAQTLVNFDHSESSDFEKDDEDGEAEEGTVESDDGDSSYRDDGNNASSSSYLDEEDEVDSNDDIRLRKKRTPSPLFLLSVEDSSEEDTKRRRRSTARARRARTPYSSSETVPEAEQSSSTEAQHSRRHKHATKVRRACAPHAPELVKEAAEHTPNTETLVKSRKPKARRTNTHTHHPEAKEGVDEDDILLTLPAPNILEDGSIECTYLGCPRTFATMGLLRSHLVVHVDGKPYVCDLCNGTKRYKRNHDLLRHQREIHGEEEEQEEAREGDEVDEAADEGDNGMNGSDAPVRRRVKCEEGSHTRGGHPRSSSGRHRKHRRTRVEHRMIWNGSEMEEIEVEMVRPRGRPRVRPLKDMPAVDAYAFISSSSSSSVTLTARPQAPSQHTDTAKRLHEWLRIEAQATAAWSAAEESTNQYTGSCSPLFIPLADEGESNQLIKREEDELVMTGQWRALNARAADIQNQDSAYALHKLKEWLSAPEGSSPRSPGSMVETIFNAPEAPASPTCNVAANIVADATERGVAAI